MESNKKNKFCYKKYATLNEESKRFTCLVEKCGKELSASCIGNLKRHYKLVHKVVIDEVDCLPLPSGIQKNNVVTKLSTNLNREEFIKCCIGLISKKNLPFRIFDDNDFFKKIIKPYEDKFGTSLNSKNIANILGDCSQGIKRAIAKIVRNKMISLKIDVASRQDKHILGVNIQYVRDFKICVNTIGMIQLNKRHTAQYLKEEIMKCLEDYNIDINQIYSNTTDNGANVIKVSKLLREMQEENLTTAEDDEPNNTNTYNAIETQLSSVFSIVRCAAHTIQLAAYDVIGTLEAEIKDVREIAKKIRTIVRTGNKDISLPCLDNVTRWNSTYDMVISILNLREYINDLDGSTNISVNWIFVESFASAFRPLAECTTHMQKEQYILGDFFRDWMICELHLQAMIHTNSNAKALYNAMGTRKLKLLEHDAFVAALYLDPRFNYQGTPLLTDKEKQTAMDHLLKTYETINSISHSTSSQAESENNSFSAYSSFVDNNTPSTSNAAYSILAEHINQLENTSNSTATNQHFHIKSELLSLCEKRKEPLGIDVLQHWKSCSQHDLKLTQLVEVVLAVPATQVSVERAFSALATVLTKLRCKLSNKSLSNILITKLNFDLLDCSDLSIETMNNNSLISTPQQILGANLP